VLPDSERYTIKPEGRPNNQCPPVQLSAANMPEVVSFYRLSNELQMLLKGTTGAGHTDADIMILALKKSNLSYCTDVTVLDDGHHYRCDLWISSVFVASGVAACCADAVDTAYACAAQLLQKPYLHLAEDANGSEVLLGSDNPFIDPPSVTTTREQQNSATSFPAVNYPFTDQSSVDGDSSTTGARVLGSSIRDIDNKKKCDSNAAVSVMLGQNFDVNNNSEAHDRSTKIPCASSELVDHSSIAVTHNKLDSCTKSSGKVLEYQPAVVISKSQKDLSSLVNQFSSLAHIAKDVVALFQRTKSIRDVFEMAVHMSDMLSKTRISPLSYGRVHCRLLVNDVVVAAAEGVDKKSAKSNAYKIAAEVVSMPYLCLEEEKHGMLQLLGSQEPFIDEMLDAIQMEAEDGKATSSFHRSLMSDNEEDALHPTTSLSCSGHSILELPTFLNTLVSWVRAKSPKKFNNSIARLQAALLSSNLHVTESFSVGNFSIHQCELSVNSVLISVSKAKRKKQAKLAAYNAAVELLSMLYLGLQEVSQSYLYQLIGSDEPFCRNISSHEHELPLTHVQQPDQSNTTLLSYSSTADKSAVYVSLLASKVKALSKCLTATRTIQEENNMLTAALDSVNLQKIFTYSRGPGKIYCCHLQANGISFSVGEGEIRKIAKLSACCAAVKLLQMPYLHLVESSNYDNMNATKVLAGSEEPLKEESYDFVSHLDISSDYLCSPVLDVVNVSEHQTVVKKLDQLVFCLKQVVSAVRTVVHILQASVHNNLKMFYYNNGSYRMLIDMALCVANPPVRLHTVNGCTLSVDGLDIAVAEAGASTDNPYKAVVELLCKPCLCLVSSQSDGCVRLVGFEEYGYNDDSFILQNDARGLDGVAPKLRSLVSRKCVLADDCESSHDVMRCCEKPSYVAGVRREPSYVVAENEEIVSSEASDETNEAIRPEVVPEACSKVSQLNIPAEGENATAVAGGDDLESRHPPTMDEKHCVGRTEVSLPSALKEFVILQGDFKRQSAWHVLRRSAAFNRLPLGCVVDGVEGDYSCRLSFGGHTLTCVTAHGRSKLSAKKAASNQALKLLAVTCYTLEMKNFNVANPLTWTQVFGDICLADRMGIS